MTGARTVRWWAFALLVALAAPIGWLVFVADGWTVNRLVVAVWSRAAALGVQASPEQTDGVLNFLMLVPSALLASLWLPRVRWWVWAAAGAATSAAIEGVQYFTARDANAYDVAFNTVGAGEPLRLAMLGGLAGFGATAVGALAGAWLNAALAARSGFVEGPVGVLGQEPGGHHGHAEHDPEEQEEGGSAGAHHDPGDQ